MAKGKFRAVFDAGDITALYRQARDTADEQRLRSLADVLRAHTRLEHEVSIPAQYKAITRQVRTPYLRDAWARIAASLVSKPPVVHVQAKDDKREEYRAAAADASRFDMALIERLNKQSGEDAIYQATAALVRDGESVLKVVHRPDAWANFPALYEGAAASEVLKAQDDAKKTRDLPFAWRVVDRLSCVFGEGEFGDSWCVEYGEYPLPYAKGRFGMAVGDDGHAYDPKAKLGGKPRPEGALLGGPGRCVKVEYWDANEWHVVVDGVEPAGWPRPNPYSPHLPLFRAKAYESESLLYSLLYLVPRLDELLTMQMNWAYLGAYPNPVEESVPSASLGPGLDGPLGDNMATESGVVWTPGKQISLPPGRKLSFLVPPPIGGDIRELSVVLRNLIEVAGIPSVMRGAATGGDSGYLANQMLAAASMQYKLASLTLQRQFEQALDFVHWMVPNVVKQTVFVQGWTEVDRKTGRPKVRADRAWLGLSPDSAGMSKNVADVSKLGPTTFQFRPTLPTDEQARAMVAVQLTNAAIPLMSVRHAQERWLEEEDPDSISEQIAVEQAMREEPLKSMILQRAMEQAGLLPPGQEQTQQPAVDPNMLAALGGQMGGQPMIPPGPGQLQPSTPGQIQGGQPAIPGLTMPLVPGGGQAPQFPPGTGGGLPAGSFPGQPPNPPVA